MKRLLFLALLLGCRDSTGVDDLKQINREYAAWQALGLKNYEYTYQQLCFCPPEINQNSTVRVVNNKVVLVTDSLGLSRPASLLSAFPTIDELYQRIISNASSSYVFSRLQFHPTMHYPTSVGADIPNAADAGYIVNASNLTAYQVPVLPSVTRDTSMAVQTDSLLYHFRMTPDFNGNQMITTVRFTARNKTNQTISWSHCNGQYDTSVQREDNGVWKQNYTRGVQACLSKPDITIAPGGTFTDSLQLMSTFTVSNLSPNFIKPNDVQGVYRLVLPSGLTTNSFVLDDPRF